ncbi:hypothetical protein [Streptomyces sp. B1I3]|uniref:hypothetical protein n=1 Tax=Streptomyces sp. B1I3 TaxID=3042264 RepID=UPI0027870D74|nr:hypothetical protein [Streptomyces sp. B1I3]MDQ0792855.1 hypothetical protein [Streptomyces sp. B1I3]
MREATARFVFTLLTAILLALQGPGPAASAASAHSAQEPAPGPPVGHTVHGTHMTAGEAGRNLVPCDTPAEDGPDHGALRTRDRHRTAVGATPESPSRSLVTDGAGDRSAGAALPAADASPRAPESSASSSPAVLQVFRC